MNDDPENGASNAIRILGQRLQGHNANKQIYSLVLLGSLAQNCGSKMHREIASKTLTTQLLDISKDRQTHQSVKSRVFDVLESLSKEFKGDPSLRQVEDTFNILKRTNPSLAPPVVPQKHQMTDLDRQREEEELQMVLALSLQESQGPSTNSTSQQSQQPSQDQQHQQEQPQSSQSATGKTAATVSRVKAIYDLNSEDPGELSFRRGDVITVLESVYRDWWKGSLRGEVGIFPLNYVTPIPEPTPQELAQEAQDEQKVFDESRNIEKLLSMLTNAQSNSSSVNIAENEELQNLYRSTQAIRPKLVKMIEKYAQKRDDLIDLDRKFMNARRSYDTLIDTSLSQIPTSSAQPPYAANNYAQSFYPQGDYQSQQPSQVPQQAPQQQVSQHVPQQVPQQPQQQQQSQPPQPNFSQYPISQNNATPSYGNPNFGRSNPPGYNSNNSGTPVSSNEYAPPSQYAPTQVPGSSVSNPGYASPSAPPAQQQAPVQPNQQASLPQNQNQWNQPPPQNVLPPNANNQPQVGAYPPGNYPPQQNSQNGSSYPGNAQTSFQPSQPPQQYQQGSEAPHYAVPTGTGHQ